MLEEVPHRDQIEPAWFADILLVEQAAVKLHGPKCRAVCEVHEVDADPRRAVPLPQMRQERPGTTSDVEHGARPCRAQQVPAADPELLAVDVTPSPNAQTRARAIPSRSRLLMRQVLVVVVVSSRARCVRRGV